MNLSKSASHAYYWMSWKRLGCLGYSSKIVICQDSDPPEAAGHSNWCMWSQQDVFCSGFWPAVRPEYATPSKMSNKCLMGLSRGAPDDIMRSITFHIQFTCMCYVFMHLLEKFWMPWILAKIRHFQDSDPPEAAGHSNLYMFSQKDIMGSGFWPAEGSRTQQRLALR